MTTEKHYLRSSYREKLVEHIFVAELAQELWLNDEIVDIARPEVDAAGYDLIVHAKEFTRHVQLKSSVSNTKLGSQTINRRLSEFPSGCVVWAMFDERKDLNRIALSYRFYGSDPGQRLPDISDFRPARHTKADSTGHKAVRPSTVRIPKSRFTQPCTMDDLVRLLFDK